MGVVTFRTPYDRTYHQSLGQFFCPSPFLSTQCLEPPGALERITSKSKRQRERLYFILWRWHVTVTNITDELVALQRSTLGVVTARVRYVPSGSLVSHRINCDELWDRTSGLSSFSKKTICRCHCKGSTFSSVIKDPECWSGWGFNLPHSSLALYQMSQPVGSWLS